MKAPTAAEPVTLTDEDIRPMVARPVNNRGVWVFGGMAAIAAILLFSALEARRTAANSPSIMTPREGSGNMISGPPPLAMPGGYDANRELGSVLLTRVPGSVNGVPYTLPGVPNTPRVMQSGYVPGPPIAPQPAAYNDPDSPFYRPLQPEPARASAPAVAQPAPSPAAAAILAGNRVGATRFVNPSATVPQGAVIQAVLETALDSNRPGFVRAIVSRDVRSFDGTKVLIERGSRLFGEYKAELASGQNRAFIQWLTLTRPDGVQIAVNSPAADPLGRAGVKGDVNSHFFQRFAGALLQSTLDLGVGLLTRSANNGTVVVGLPGSTSIVNNNSNQPQPTLKVKHGAAVSVFVARDLDFTSVL